MDTLKELLITAITHLKEDNPNVKEILTLLHGALIESKGKIGTSRSDMRARSCINEILGHYSIHFLTSPSSHGREVRDNLASLAVITYLEKKVEQIHQHERDPRVGCRVIAPMLSRRYDALEPLDEEILDTVMEVVVACASNMMVSSITLPMQRLMERIESIPMDDRTLRMLDVARYMEEQGWSSSGFKGYPDTASIGIYLQQLYGLL